MSDYISHEDMMRIPATEVSNPSKIAAEPVVSVIMMTYNHEPYIAQAIEGVITQQCDFPIELLIGEDCSTDRTRDICFEYQQRYPELIRLLIAETNVGMHKNMFRLLGRSKGRYIAFCEGDDYWCDECKLQKQVAFLEANRDHALCIHNAQVIYQDADTKPHSFSRKLPLTLSAAEIIEHDWLIPTASMVFRRTVITRFPEEFCTFPSGDLALSILAAAEGNVHCFTECMSVYRKHQGGDHYTLSINLQQRLIYWERVNAMLHSLDRTLKGEFRQSFQRRINQNRRRMDYLQLRNTLQFSPRLIWSTIVYLHYRSCMKRRLHRT
jgi:glycosyltransferase involved in cell wall biosynthesis